jgi:hypothetical protein
MLDVELHQGRAVGLIHCAENKVCHNQPYATLSHCWGKVQVIQTTIQNLKERTKGIDWDLLPKTFQDAITIVRALNVRFLWIDSLCIIQNDESDWKAESVRMADVYSNSYINIAATGSSDSRGGCLARRCLKHMSPMIDTTSFAIVTPTDHEQPTVFVRPSFNRIHNRYSTRSNSGLNLPDAGTVPLLSRAWVFQERYLAPRTLHFHPSEMVMECRSGFYCECTGLDKIALGSRRNFQEARTLRGRRAFDSWFDVVEEFSRLHLTWESDRLPALTGVATVFQERLQSGYLAGLWEKDIARGLLWDVTRYADLQNSRCVRRRRTPLSVPSWSWASLILGTGGFGIVFPSGRDDGFKADSRFALSYSNMSMAAADANSSPRDGILWLRGLVVPAIGCFVGASDSSEKDMILIFGRDVNDMVLVSTADMNLDVTRNEDEASLEDFDEAVHCLMIGETADNSRHAYMEDSSCDSDGSREDSPTPDSAKYLCVLVLRQCHKDINYYERIGIIDLKMQWGLFDNASEMTMMVR